MITVLIGLFYLTDDFEPVPSILLFLIILVIHLVFIVFWVRGLAKVLLGKYIEHRMNKLQKKLELNRENENSELKQHSAPADFAMFDQSELEDLSNSRANLDDEESASNN
jgi:hypothetical protein